MHGQFCMGDNSSHNIGQPAKVSISARDLGGVSAPYKTMIGSLTCCAAMRNASRNPAVNSAIVLSRAATGWLFSKNLTDKIAAKLSKM